MTQRPDLAALTDDGLIQLSNAGLVKRALREQAEGKGPQLSQKPDGGVEALFPDGTVTRLAPGKTLAQADCACPSSGVCRHRVGLVIAYRAAHGGGERVAEWDPATLDLPALEAMLDGAERASLARLRQSGVHARLTRGATPAAALPMASVRFLAPNDLSYARCDCARGAGCAHVALAIEAFQRAQGASETTIGGAHENATIDSLREASDALIARLLCEGATAGMEAHGAAIDHALALARMQGAAWHVLVLEDIGAQIAAYDARSARYDAETLLSLIVELYARPRAIGVAAMGYGEPMETAMSKTRLVSLGARILQRGRDFDAVIALIDSDTGAAMLMRRTFAPTEEERLTPADLLNRPMERGLPLAQLARGQALSAAAKRRADGLVSFSNSGGARTSLMGRGPIVTAPGSVFVDDLAKLRADFAQRPPAFLRPRNLVGDLHVFRVENVLGQGWDPAAQIWRAAVTLQGGEQLTLERRWDAGAPQAIDILTQTLAQEGLRQVAGILRFDHGEAICDPWSLSNERFIAPDVETGTPRSAPVANGAARPDPMRAARTALAGAIHAGSRRRPGARREDDRLLSELEAAGFPLSAKRLRAAGAAPQDVDAFARAAMLMETLRGG